VAISKYLLGLAGFSRQREVELARASRAQGERQLRSTLDADESRFREAMAERARRPHVQLGTAEGGVPYLLPLQDLTGTFAWVTAGTGSGKSRFIASVGERLIALGERGERVATIIFDLKGGEDSLSDLALRAVAAKAAALPNARRRNFLAKVVTLRFFAGDFLPELQLLRREPAVAPVVQAHAVAEILDHAIQTNLGARQANALGAILALAIESGLSLLDLRYLLYDPARIVALAARSEIPEVRLYVKTRLGRENAMTIDGLAARLDALLRVDAIKAALAGPRMFDFRRCFEPGTVTVIDLGSPPMGAESAKAALAAMVFTRLTWATFDPTRRVSGATCIFADEIQECVKTPSTLDHLARLTSTGRAFHTGLWSIHQGATQLPGNLQELLAQNVQLRVVGRGSAAESHAAAEWIPRTGRVPRPRLSGTPPGERPEFLSDADELRMRVAALARLERQHFLVGDRAASFTSRTIMAPTMNPPRWSAVDPVIREAVLRGSVGVSRAELLSRASAIETEAARIQEARQPDDDARSGKRSRGARASEMPDVASTRRPRRGGEEL
jgi:hypothetical protein